MVDIARKAGKLPRSVHNDSIMWARRGYDWTMGFFPGSLWYLYELTDDDTWKESAIYFQRMVEKYRFHSNHDLGFNFTTTYGMGLRLTKDSSYIPVLVDAGNTLAERFDPAVGCIKSWNVDRGWQSRRGWQFPVIIDNMMNLELLFELSEITGDSRYADIAIAHANTTMNNHFREDNSSWHVVDYDSVTGAVRSKVTAQGYSDESAWSRGQAWGLYGYTMCYRYTKNKEYLDLAEKIATLILEDPAVKENDVPYWDFDAPEIPNEPRDVSAAAITCSALIELSGYTGGRYLGRAKEIFTTMSGDGYFAKPGENHNYLLKHGTGSIPHNSEIDEPLVYADYYYLESLLRLSRP